MRMLIYHAPNMLLTGMISGFSKLDKNFICETTENYLEAIDILLTYKPEIIILDLEQNNGEGAEFLKRIKDDYSDVKEIKLFDFPSSRIIVIDHSKSLINLDSCSLK